MAWMPLEEWEAERNRLRHKKVKTKTKIFGNCSSEWAVATKNLVEIEPGSIGIIIEFNEDVEMPVTFVTVRFPDGIFANVSLNVLDILN